MDDFGWDDEEWGDDDWDEDDWGDQGKFKSQVRAAQCIDKEILISKNGNIDIDIEIDKRMF